ncbi:MAG: FAD-dependent oxidoreductase [Thermodesulfovibrionales bacterium]|jgi:protoporphyrinogen oxidase
MKEKTDVLIIGAGVSGCASAQALQARGIKYLLLEKNAEPGGLTRSISLGDASFDYTGHYLHLSRWSSPSQIPYAKQNDNDWHIVKRKSSVYLDNSFIPAPFQYNLCALPKTARRKCIQDFRNRILESNSRSLKEYLLSGFGSGMCELFFFPYIEKQLAVSIDELSVNAVNRFFPYPDPEKIENGCRKRKIKIDDEYNGYFWYPKQKGIGILAQGLAEGLMHLRTSCPIKKISLRRKCVETASGEIRYEKLITSIPLKLFCLMSDDENLRELGSLLAHNRVLCLNLLFNGPLCSDLEKRHWIYLPEQNTPFYRLGVYPNIYYPSESLSQRGVYVEVSYSHTAPLPPLNDIIDEVFCSLEKLYWADRKNCMVISANWIEYAYVYFDHLHKETVPAICEILQKNQTYPIGRYGLWDYISMEDSIESGIRAATEITS